jgi:branched-subunit amino acid transport protein
MEALLDIPKYSPAWAWLVLLLAALGTYAWRGLGVLLSGKLSQDSPMFRWITCVTYAMVASLVIRIIVLPVGVLAQVPLSYRLIAAGTAFAIMLSRKNALLPAISAGTALIILFAWLG